MRVLFKFRQCKVLLWQSSGVWSSFKFSVPSCVILFRHSWSRPKLIYKSHPWTPDENFSMFEICHQTFSTFTTIRQPALYLNITCKIVEKSFDLYCSLIKWFKYFALLMFIYETLNEECCWYRINCTCH